MFGFIGAKAQNPFAEYGYTPKIATLSQGQFNEFFDNDTIVQIGSVLYNTKSREIVAFVDSENLCQDETIQPDVVSRWISPDPLADHPNLIGWSPYHYAYNNPIKYTDPDGRCPDCLWDALSLSMGVKSFVSNVKQGNYWSATLDGVGVLADGVALAIPLVPGGAGAIIKVARGADDVIDVAKGMDKANDTRKAIGPAGDAGGQVMKQLPEDMQKNMRTSDNGGTIFKDPKNPGGNNVRVEPGNPQSPNPAQQNPYVKQVKDGKVVDVNGKPIPGEKPAKTVDSHIPKEDFKYDKK